MREITVSFGTSHPAHITAVRSTTWAKFAAWLTAQPPETADKAVRGWWIPATFDPAYRDGDNFVSRDCLTYDFDKVTLDTYGLALHTWANWAHAIYTTYSHTPEAPRFRVVLPLSRAVSYDEFQAISRMVATDIGIELIARESFVPAQMMYAPTRRPLAPFDSFVSTSVNFLQADDVLARYEDWTDVKQWPRRLERDGVHSVTGGQTPPNEKPGLVGDFCRAFRVSDAIRQFDLPYRPTQTPGRWTYIHGSRPEGAIEYDGGLKFHSHHDTDPARGQNNAFDLVRLHRFAALDAGTSEGVSVADRASYRAMLEWARGVLPPPGESDVYLPLPPVVTAEVISHADGTARERFRPWHADEFASGASMDWLVRNVLPRAELAVIYGESGSGKSFLALDLSAAISRGVAWRGQRTAAGKVVYVCAEGAGGYRARLRAYSRQHNVSLRELPAVISDAPNLLDPKDAALITHQIVKWGKVDVVVIDTLSATTPGGNENSGEDMGLVLSHCKLLHRETGALVVLIHHSGKDATKGARGWSGLRAAADAEIEVTRNGDFRTATTTKMKDGEDGEAMTFKLRPLVLGVNAYGEEETSCIVEHVDNIQRAPMQKRLPTGTGLAVLEVLRTMAPCGTVDRTDLLKGVEKKLGETTRETHADRALRKLIETGWAYADPNDGTRISLTSTIEVAEDWLE